MQNDNNQAGVSAAGDVLKHFFTFDYIDCAHNACYDLHALCK